MIFENSRKNISYLAVKISLQGRVELGLTLRPPVDS